MNAASNGGMYLVSVLFDLYIYVVLVRLILQYQGANYYNPISQFILKLTEPVIKPLKKFIPGFKGVDLSIVVFAVVLVLVKVLLLFLIKVGFPNIFGLLLFSLGDLLGKLVNIYFWAIIINAIMSWVPSLSSNPLSEVVALISEPVLRIPRRFIPPIGGFDLSPIAAIIILQLISIVLIAPILAKALMMIV